MVKLATIARFLGPASLAVALAGVVACVPDEEEGENPNTPAQAKAKPVSKEDQGNKLLEEAKKATDDGNFALAREKLRDASDLDIGSQRVPIADLRDKVDRGQAKRWAQDTEPKFKANDCAGAFRMLHEPLAVLGKSHVFADELRRLVSASAHPCVDEAVDTKLRSSNFAAAREYLNSPDIKTVLGEEPWKKLVVSVDMTIVEALTSKLGNNYVEAVKKIDSMKSSGEATEEQATQLRTAIRENAANDLVQQANQAAGRPEAPKVLQQIDASIRALGWELPEANATGSEGPPPAELVKARADLAASASKGKAPPAPAGKNKKKK